ncbi:MAG: NHL repeat-containing protein, partial [Candidatus Omnitrophica bacterium]|nr:NHL repeat-containing protein [Candidatus Omnitrophota bacterium]
MMVYFKQSKNQIEPKKLTAKFTFGKKGKEFEEFNRPVDVAVKDNFLFVADSGNSRIQVLKINPDGSLSPVLSFGKEGKELGEFNGFSGLDISIKDNLLFVADSGNSRIQVLKINPDGSLSPVLSFGKEGKELGEFGRAPAPLGYAAPLGLCIKDNLLFVADSGNSRIQVLKINPDGSLSPVLSFGKE